MCNEAYLVLMRQSQISLEFEITSLLRLVLCGNLTKKKNHYTIFIDLPNDKYISDTLLAI